MFCTRCAAPLVQRRELFQYSVTTGLPTYKYTRECPRRMTLLARLLPPLGWYHTVLWIYADTDREAQEVQPFRWQS